jgi:Interleukin-like EMT inducer
VRRHISIAALLGRPESVSGAATRPPSLPSRDATGLTVPPLRNDDVRVLTGPAGLADGIRTPVSTGFGWHRAVTLYGVLAVGVVAATWPLATNPATLWPPHHDARIFTWVMTSMARRLVTEPLHLFHGNAFYPSGASLAYSELLLPPTLLGLPGFLWGNPILTYNLLLLALWPLNGLAIAWAAHRLTRSWPGAWVAGAVFCLSPYFTEYYLEFQMLLAAPLPIAMLAWVRWLETAQGRWLGLGLVGLAVQTLTTWYYGIILSLGLATLSIGVLCLRLEGVIWRRVLFGVAAGAAGLSAVLLPFAVPYLAVRQEAGYERELTETATHYADLATFVEPGTRSLLYRFSPSGQIAETSAFPGFTVFGLAAASILWLRRDRPISAWPARLGRAGCVALVAALAGTAWAIQFPRARYWLGPLIVRPRARELLYVALVVGLVLLVIRGWNARLRGRSSRLTEGDWVRLLLLLTAVFAVLALGPVIHVARREVGPGPYADLYPVLFPLHVVRVTVRFAVLTLVGLALLAAFGLRAIEERLTGRPWLRRWVVVAVLLALALEYAVAPAAYDSERWAPRPVDERLRADPDDVAVLEWPPKLGDTAADAMFRSLWHGKRIVNGFSGYVPAFNRVLHAFFLAPGFSPEAETALRQIYPLRYLVVRVTEPDLATEWIAGWLAARRSPPPLLRFKGTFGDDDLYELVPLPERGVRSERWVSRDFLRRHPVLALRLRPGVLDPDVDQSVEVVLNGTLVERLALNAEATERLLLPPPTRRAAPNVIELRYGYRRPGFAPDDRYQIGTTGLLSPGDLRVSSAGKPYGNASSILFNGTELSRNGRGYNVAALDPGGRVIEMASFDTFETTAASRKLETWVRQLPMGTIVAGAISDEASVYLTRGAVAALRMLGVVGNLRGRYRESHAFVGVKGADPGMALEAFGPHRIDLSVGRPRLDLGYELTDFVLTSPAGTR